MWPYNDEEAGWLTPPPQATAKPVPPTANDNRPARRGPVPVAPEAQPVLRKPDRET